MDLIASFLVLGAAFLLTAWWLRSGVHIHVYLDARQTGEPPDTDPMPANIRQYLELESDASIVDGRKRRACELYGLLHDWDAVFGELQQEDMD